MYEISFEKFIEAIEGEKLIRFIKKHSLLAVYDRNTGRLKVYSFERYSHIYEAYLGTPDIATKEIGPILVWISETVDQFVEDEERNDQ